MSVGSNELEAGRKMITSRTRSARHHAPASFAFPLKIRAGCSSGTCFGVSWEVQIKGACTVNIPKGLGTQHCNTTRLRAHASTSLVSPAPHVLPFPPAAAPPQFPRQSPPGHPPAAGCTVSLPGHSPAPENAISLGTNTYHPQDTGTSFISGGVLQRTTETYRGVFGPMKMRCFPFLCFDSILDCSSTEVYLT